MLKQLAAATYRPLLKRYLANPRKYSYEDISIVVEPGVFHPAFFFSTKLLLDFLKSLDVKGKSFLELGAGSGLVAVYAAKKGAIVTASDISSAAVRNIKHNAEINAVNVEVVHSDMFDNMGNKRFDMIMVNPPYFKKNPQKEADHAWYCGENGEYFQKFFSQLGAYIQEDSKVFMVLSNECDEETIKLLAKKNSFDMTVVHSAKRFWEMNYIYQINKTK